LNDAIACPSESIANDAAQFKLKMPLLALFGPNLARKAHVVTRKRVNIRMSQRAQRIAGIDGCKSGWLIVEANGDLSKAELRFARDWNNVNCTAKIVAVDMPIGISHRGVRQCEVEARKRLSPYATRVFKSLSRGALRFAQSEWKTANQWSKDQGFGGISKQIWNIRPKINEIDRAVTPKDQSRIYEAHPELAFARLNGGRPLDSKHTPEGLRTRKRLLKREGFTNLDNWLQQLRGNGAKADDLFDACALTITARNILHGRAIHLPEVVESDSRNLRMSISY
jgi:predicted RNase H-like nuclease